MLKFRGVYADMGVVMVGVVEAQEEESREETEEDPGDQEPVSKSHKALSQKVEEANGRDDGVARDCRELTLVKSDWKYFEGLVTDFRPRKREKYSHSRMACMVDRLHWVFCCHVAVSFELRYREGAYQS